MKDRAHVLGLFLPLKPLVGVCLFLEEESGALIAVLIDGTIEDVHLQRRENCLIGSVFGSKFTVDSEIE